MAQTGDDGRGELFWILCDDLKPDGTAAGFHGFIRYGAGGEAVDDAQDHRLDLKIVDKIADESHHRVQRECDIKKVQAGLLFADQTGNKVCAAGIGAGMDQLGVNTAVDDTGNQRPQNGAGTGIGGVSEGGNVNVFQNGQGDGEAEYIHHRPKRNGFADFFVYQKSQGQIDQKIQRADLNIEQVLEHGANAVQARRGKFVGENK